MKKRINENSLSPVSKVPFPEEAALQITSHKPHIMVNPESLKVITAKPQDSKL
ncbi:hypothetical protein [Elizabethkingia anophelis]|uniref:hypothetical protein n=1 Tax=Elizabethkingia anophelis TaxID=1117645 RepID=UPI0013F600FF|nr:hypothetical protein [Elizabethkingia anophelis]MCT4285731.1 hypothetical protein [Elizabethkingia anophelis]